MNNSELFDYLIWSLKCIEKSNNLYINTGLEFWKSQLVRDILRYVGALKQARQQIPKEAACFPEFMVHKRGKQITVYTLYFDLIL